MRPYRMFVAGVLSLVVLLALSASPTHATQLWGAAADMQDWTKEVQLFRFETSTGTVLWQRTYNNDFGYFIGDIAQTPNGNLYVTDANNKLHRLNTAGDILNTWNLGVMLNALEADGNSTLYFLDNTTGGANRGYLGTIALDGSGGYSSHSYVGFVDDYPEADLVWNNGKLLGTFWASAGSKLHTIDPADGSVDGTVQTNLGYVAGLAWGSPQLWAGSWYEGLGVYTIDVNTGNKTLQWNLSSQLDFDMTGITGMAVVPEPSALLLLASGLAGLGATTWRRSRRR